MIYILIIYAAITSLITMPTMEDCKRAAAMYASAECIAVPVVRPSSDTVQPPTQESCRE